MHGKISYLEYQDIIIILIIIVHLGPDIKVNLKVKYIKQEGEKVEK